MGTCCYSVFITTIVTIITINTIEASLILISPPATVPNSLNEFLGSLSLKFLYPNSLLKNISIRLSTPYSPILLLLKSPMMSTLLNLTATSQAEAHLTIRSIYRVEYSMDLNTM